MKDEQKAKLEALAERTVNWGRETFTPKRMKKAVGVVLVLAVAGAGGKFALHRTRAAARMEEARARSSLLQNLAASENVTLLTTDAVKEKVAQALGTTPDAVNFRTVLLADKGPKDFRGPKDKKFKKDKKDGQHREKKANRDGRREKNRAPRGPENREMPPEGTQNGPDRRMAFGPQPDMPAQNGMPAATRQNGKFPAFYLADCEMSGMKYRFVIDAQTGKILRSQVHKAGLLSSFLA